MKKIIALFPGTEDAELCLMKLSPYITSAALEPLAAFDAPVLPSADCGLNTFWGVDPMYQWINGTAAYERKNIKLRADFPNRFESTVQRIIRQFGGICESE